MRQKYDDASLRGVLKADEKTPPSCAVEMLKSISTRICYALC